MARLLNTVIGLFYYLLFTSITMKTNIFTLFLMAIFIAPLTSCNKDGDNDPDGAELTGTWTLQRTETTYKLTEENEETIVRDYTTEDSPSTVTFTSDGRLLVKDWNEDEDSYIETNGEYEIVDGRIHASIAGDFFGFDDGFTYSIAGNTLTIT